MIIVNGIEWLKALTAIPFNPGKLEIGMRKTHKITKKYIFLNPTIVFY